MPILFQPPRRWNDRVMKLVTSGMGLRLISFRIGFDDSAATLSSLLTALLQAAIAAQI